MTSEEPSTSGALGVPEAEAMWGAARSYVMEYANQTDDLVFNDRPISREHAAKISMIGPAMASLCRMAVDIALELVGTDAIQAKRPWDHLFQDFRTGAAHVVHRRRRPLAAAILNGAPPRRRR